MITLSDGRSELYQWDTGRTLTVDASCSQVHFANRVYGRSLDVDVVDGSALIPDVLLQSDSDLRVWGFVGTQGNGFTKISKIFRVNWRNKPADYVFTPPEQTTLKEIKNAVDDHENRISRLEKYGTGSGLAYEIGFGLSVSEDYVLSAEVGASSFMEIPNTKVQEIFNRAMTEV